MKEIQIETIRLKSLPAKQQRKKEALSYYDFQVLDPIIYENQTRTLIQIIAMNKKAVPWYRQPRLWLYDNKPDSFYHTPNTTKKSGHSRLKAGQYYRGVLTVRQPYSKRNDAGFDVELAALANGIQGTATLSQKKNTYLYMLTPPQRTPWQQSYYHKVIQWLDQSAEKPLILAFSFADRLQLTDEDWQLYRQLGLSHLLAISGLHIGLAMGSGWWLGKLLLRLFIISSLSIDRLIRSRFFTFIASMSSYFSPKKTLFSAVYLMPRETLSVFLQLISFWLPLFLGFTFAIAYAWLAGFTLPTLRALIACLFIGISFFSSFHIAHWRLWGYTLFIYLMIDPFAPLQISFWLSFSAVAILALYFSYQQKQFNFEQYRTRSDHSTRLSRLFQSVKQLIIVQSLLCLAMLPVQSYFFYGVSLFAPIVNLIVIPYVSFVIVPFILFGLFCALFSNPLMTLLGKNLFSIADYNLQLLRKVLIAFPDNWLSIPYMQWFHYLLLVIAILYFFYGTSRLFAFVTASVLLLAIFKPFHLSQNQIVQSSLSQQTQSDTQLPTQWKLSVIDVGQGLSILIEKNGKYIIYDTGPSWHTGSIAESVLEPMLQRRGVSQLDGLILSHADNDHAGGAHFLEERYAPLWRRSSDYRKNYRPCKRGMQWFWQGLKMQVLSPNKLTTRANNNNSCVLLISDHSFTALLTGDIEKGSELHLTAYLRRLGIKQIDLLIVPHHGSKTSSTQPLLQQLNPSLAIASVGKFNRFNHPSPEIIQRYQHLKIPFLTTALDGQITVHINATGETGNTKKWSVERIREKEKWYWYRKMFIFPL